MISCTAGSKAFAILVETQVQETEVCRAIYSILRESFAEHTEQILWRAAESLERALAQADATGCLDERNNSELEVRKEMRWDDAIERARSCRRL